MNKNSKIYVAGSSGMVGSAIVRKLKKNGYQNIIESNSHDLDLINQNDVNNFFDKHCFDYVFVAAAKVGGILANSTKKADFIYQNLQIQNNLIHYSWKTNVKKLLFLGSSCIYPKDSRIPIKESELLSGKLEETNDAYAIAKIAGIKMCQSYRQQHGFNAISIMPTNLYGYNDNFDLQASHVIPALIRKFTEAKKINDPEVICWGSGTPLREFLFVDDLADACIFLMKEYNDGEHVNVGTGIDISILELSEKIKKITGFEGEIVWDKSKPDGTKRKVLDVSKINHLGWKSKVSIDEGLELTIDWYTNE
tara:strand:- start:6774 stop:7697 length:924 start_codon:yes stop_codon:yes gene_type:complete